MKITKRIKRLQDQLINTKAPKDKAQLEIRIKQLNNKRRAKYGKEAIA